MARDRTGEEIEENRQSGYSKSDDNLTYEIPGETITIKCCLCRKPLKKGSRGWCANCDTWPINITPVRFCNGGHRVNPDGWCPSCTDYVLSCLDPIDAQWIDTGRVPKRLEREKVKQRVADVSAKLSGPGWPDKIVPLRSDMIPRSWKRRKLVVVGQTELGYDIVIPEAAGIVEPVTDAEVPF